MDSLKLDAAVGLLTRRSPHIVTDPDGKARVVLAEPLLVQLAMAVGNSSAPPEPGVSSSGKPIPMSADAHDLLERIREDAAAYWWQSYHPARQARPPKILGRRTLVGQIHGWVAVARADEEALRIAEKVLCRWVTDIQALFNPQRRRPLPGAACPNKKCGASRVLDREEDGEHFYKPAMVKLYDDEGFFTRVECGACGESWTGLEMELMAK